jgi:hypothetical protein
MPSDMGEMWREHRELKRQRHEANLKSADPAGWTIHTSYHWSRELLGKRLDYWPSTNKFQYEGRVMTGEVMDFINKRTPGE